MNTTVFFTILAGVMTYVIGQLVLRLVIEPVQHMKHTIGEISYALIYNANVISNPGVPSKQRVQEALERLRTLSAQLQSHLYLVPQYERTARIFCLPTRDEILSAVTALINLSNSVFTASEGIHRVNSKNVARVCDALMIYLPQDERWPDEEADT